MFPFIWALNGVSNFVLKMFGIPPASSEEMAHSPEELRMILAHSEEAGVFSEPSREIIEGVFQFSRRTARQIMVPRTDVHVLSVNLFIEQNLEIIRTSEQPRYPLVDGTLVNALGLVQVKDFFQVALR